MPSEAAVAVLVGADRVSDDPVADGEARDILADFDDLAGDVGSQHGRVGQPPVGQVGSDLDDPVQRVDRDRVSAHDDLVVAGLGVRGVLDLELRHEGRSARRRSWRDGRCLAWSELLLEMVDCTWCSAQHDRSLH